MNNEYYLIEGEERKGPYTYKELISLDINIYTEISMNNTKPVYASYIPELNDYFATQGYLFPTEENIADAGRRTLAFMIDYIILSVFVMFCLLETGIMALPKGDQFNPTETLTKLKPYIYIIEGCSAGLFLLYNIILETTMRGSLGKMILGLKVVDEDGQRLTLVKSLLRNIGALTGINMIGLAIVAVTFFSGEVRQTWYEKLTKTYVIKPEN